MMQKFEKQVKSETGLNNDSTVFNEAERGMYCNFVDHFKFWQIWHKIPS